MRVLWFTNTPSCYSQGNNPYNGGGWISSAEIAFRQIPDITLGVSFILNNQPFKSEGSGVTYYPIPDCKRTFSQKILKYFSYFSEASANKFQETFWPYYLEYFQKIINDFNPDVIHIWGSESYFGLVSRITDIPVVLHVQGVLTPYLNAFLPPFVSWKICGFNLCKKIKAFLEKREWQMNCHRERYIYSGITSYLGRTEWDKSVCHILNPQASYFHVDEILRDSFYCEMQRNIPETLTIVTTISSPLYKGFDLVLKTAKILKENLKLEFQWNCYGNINPDFIESVVGIKHEDVNVRLKGIASSKDLIEGELNATLYFHSSYIDNSPNSLCEAQMLAVPVISTNVGGISSLIEHGKTGFLIPANDPYQAAYLIEHLYFNRELNITIGNNAKEVARVRHDKNRIINQILGVYQSVIEY